MYEERIGRVREDPIDGPVAKRKGLIKTSRSGKVLAIEDLTTGQVYYKLSKVCKATEGI